jgi:tRNA nucleotidyltransferase (CCA-adding enzyme)
MVDTRDADRLGELASLAEDPQVELVVYDHHPHMDCDVDRGEDRSREVGRPPRSSCTRSASVRSL